MRLLNTFILLSTFILSGSLGLAATYVIDTGHSQVGFKIRHLVSKTQGHFKTFSGTIDFDEKNPEKISVLVTIHTPSIDTNNTGRDKHLKNEDFFNVEEYPTMTFKSTHAQKQEGKIIRVIGDLTLLGVTKPVSLDVVYIGQALDPWGGTRIGFSAAGTLNRKDFGMEYNTLLDSGGWVIGNEVEILIEVEGIKKK